ncbi:AAA family ATPase [Nonomuraea sp. 3N208]|uniref:AAA family ATPase n=1 Tax=Nonomuraea sp. 3N208 TaxID=3457421 RepID=UPI003FD3BE3A
MSTGLADGNRMMRGRDDEIRALDRLLDAARAGRGGALMVCGEPGMGKSALLGAAAERAGGLRVLTAAGSEAESGLVFGGLHQLLAPLWADPGLLAGLPPAQLEALHIAMGLRTAPCTDFLLYTAVLRLLDDAAARQPLLLAIDDLHLWDATSTAALMFVARRVAGRPVAVLFAVEGADGGDVSLPMLLLRGLVPQEAHEVLDGLGVARDVPYRQALIAAAAGNPLVLTELAAGAADMAEDGTPAPGVPARSRLRSMFGERLRGLPGATRSIMVLAAADSTSRAGVIAGAAARLGLDVAALEPAERAGLVERRGDDLIIRHSLTRSLARDEAGPAALRAAHRALAGELGARGEEDRALWHHAMAAEGADETLADRLEERASLVAQHGGLAGTANALRLAAALSGTPRDRGRRLAAAGYAAWKSGQPTLARSLAAECAVTSLVPEAAAMLERLRGLIALGDGDQRAAYDHLTRSARALARERPEFAVGLLFMAAIAAHHADLSDGFASVAGDIVGMSPGFARYGRLLGGITDLAPAADPWRLRAEAPAALRAGDVHQWLWPLIISKFSTPRLAYAFGLEAESEFSANGMHAVLTLPALWLSELEHELGLWPQGIARAEEGLRSARDTGQRSKQADFHAVLAMFAAMRGDAAECWRQARHALELALPLHNRLAAARSTWALSLLDLSAGSYEIAAERLETIGDPHSPVAHAHVGRLAAADLVEAHVRAGDFERAHRAFGAFEPWAERAAAPLPGHLLRRCRALLAGKDDDRGKLYAEACADAAAEHPFEYARTALLYGEWLRRTRRSGRARPLLRMAYETFERLGASPWTCAAQTQLRPTGGGPATTLANGALTPQELRIARFAATGMSNREIGTRLFLSPRTVGYHLHKIFPKLGIANRAQLRDLDLPEP